MLLTHVAKKSLLFIISVSLSFSLKAQYTDTSSVQNSSANKYMYRHFDSVSYKKPFPAKSFILPGAMFLYGVTSIKTDAFQDINESLKEEIWEDHPHKLVHIDNYLQFAPAVAVYGLNLAGIQGKHNLLDRSMIYLMSNIFLNVAVTPIKNITKEQRPDGSSYTSFPSGHTAEAFASAEFLREEYKDVSPWYGIGGYAVATATGLLRMYNNKHWMSDVVAGAGIGLASTRLAYWLYPIITKKVFKSKHTSSMLMPYYQDHTAGFSFVHTFSGTN